MSWKRSSLADTGFFYDEDLYDEDLRNEDRKNEDRTQFPPHVESLEQAMLDFTCQELDLPTRKDLNIQREAQRLANGGFSEDRWVDFFRTFFFNPLLQHASVSGGRSRIIVSNSKRKHEEQKLTTIIATLTLCWGTFDRNKEENEVFKTPKPDLVFYLPMYHLDTYIPTITDHEAQQWHKASTPSLVEPFSWSTLKKLHGFGLLATPFNVLNKEEPQEPQEQDLSCFPWLVVEYKKAKNAPGELDRLKEVVYCQAANASGCAVKLNQNAARYAVKLAYGAEVPPVSSVTTVGPQVKVWITFFAKDFMAYRCDVNGNQKFKRQEKGYMMQCIWTGDMTEPQDILKFRLILENTYTWAKRVFKPLIATYIDQWKFACTNGIPSAANTEMKRRQERMELSRCALRLALASRDAQRSVQPPGFSYRSVTNSLIDLCDRFVQDVDRVIEEELRRSSGDKQRASSCNTTRRRARTPSEQSRKPRQASETNSDGLKHNGNVDSQPKRSGSPDSADMTPLSAPRRSPRLEPRNKPQPSLEISSRVETVSSCLRVAMAAGAPRRRQSQSKYLAPPIESELFGIVADEDISLGNLSQDVV
ncbi:hypothetical protein FOMG_10775 [Fusarium oxysporum f. sp. melonis 26406]|uniref:Uncharacterized protein n=1 Tax=Fusarium oxysporum f. sp. melonis 26406 TaxID=1089452 RepID=X0AK86_FUSOX|nr:hypothetical protein FOMG_10775 [Fusarium oxysporum f. sp. melonis 26406]